jgi:hypothetical protein
VQATSDRQGAGYTATDLEYVRIVLANPKAEGIYREPAERAVARATMSIPFAQRAPQANRSEAGDGTIAETKSGERVLGYNER